MLNIIKMAGGFIGNHMDWLLIAAFVGLLGFLFWENERLSNLADKRLADKQKAVEDYKDTVDALKATEVQKNRQIDALQEANAEIQNERVLLNDIVIEAKESDEEIECPPPDYVRRAFERM